MRSLLLTLLLVVAIVPAAAQTPAEDDNRFGVVEGMWFPDLTCELGAGWERIIFDWSQHQPEGPDDWYTLNVDDRWLKAASACNREVVAIVKNVPDWATDGTPGPGVPLGLDLPVEDPGNYWANFMRRTAEYYAPRGVHRFIIGNEPDISRETYGFEFEGELEDYFLMLKTAYLAAKSANPAAQIHLAATTYWHDANTGRRLYMDRLLERIRSDPDSEANDEYFDVFSLHIYFRVETIPQIVGLMRGLLEQYGMGDKAIWINEMNAAPTADPAWPVERPQFPLDLEQQAAFLIQGAALGLASGVERMAVYKLVDQGLPEGGESFGILTPGSNAPRPAFYAWRTVAQTFTDVIRAEEARSEQVHAVRLFHADGRQTVVVWALNAQAASVEIGGAGDKVYAVDMAGHRTLLRSADGVYRLTLPAARCNDNDGCFIGGVPAVIISSADAPVSVTDTTGGTRAPVDFPAQP